MNNGNEIKPDKNLLSLEEHIKLGKEKPSDDIGLDDFTKKIMDEFIDELVTNCNTMIGHVMAHEDDKAEEVKIKNAGIVEKTSTLISGIYGQRFEVVKQGLEEQVQMIFHKCYVKYMADNNDVQNLKG